MTGSTTQDPLAAAGSSLMQIIMGRLESQTPQEALRFTLSAFIAAGECGAFDFENALLCARQDARKAAEREKTS